MPNLYTKVCLHCYGNIASVGHSHTPHDNKAAVPSEGAHTFTPAADDWGWAAFAEPSVVYAPDAGFLSCTGTRLTITLWVRLDHWAQQSQDRVCCPLLTPPCVLSCALDLQLYP